ncbi:unnamed protein product [Pylaiella littoralis]
MRKSGVKFGLIGTASSLKKGGAPANKGRPIGSKPAPRRRPPGATSVFDADSDDEEGGPKADLNGVAAVNKRLAAISAKQEKAAKKEYEDALEADPSVFDYDRVYDGMKESRESKAVATTVAHEKEKRQPKYIGNLLKQAKMRAVESDRIFDRKLQKEREEQDKLEGEATMKFVTSAYKKKLMEQKKWELQQQLEDEREQRNDVTKTGMSGFYSNLITKNIAMGGDVEKSANSAFTAGSKRHAATADYEMQDGSAKAKTPYVRRKSSDDDDGDDDDDQDAAGTDMRAERGDKSSPEKAHEQETDTGPTARMVDSRAAEAKRREAVPMGTRGHDESTAVRRREERDEDDAPGDPEGSAKRARLGEEGGAGASSGASSEVAVTGGGVQQPQEATAEEKSAVEELEKVKKAAAAKVKKEAAVKAARERFLARKKAA